MNWCSVTFALAAVANLGAESHPHRAIGFDLRELDNPTQAEIRERAKGPAVVRAQILLGRQHFSAGEIDGEFGTNLRKTVTAFQQDRQLAVTGRVDAATWAALNGDTAPVTIAYAVTQADAQGPFVEIPKTMEDQAKLPALGYSSLLEELAERFHVSPRVLQALNPGADFSQVGQVIRAPNVLTMPPPAAARLVVTKTESSVRAYSDDGKLLAFYVATIGSEHDPLPVGEWKIRGVSRNPVFHYNPDLFWDAKDTDQKATIHAGPNNPVGLAWIDLSKEHYGIHGTPEPSLIGHAASHGCIRLTNWDALELAGIVKPGTPAVMKE